MKPTPPFVFALAVLLSAAAGAPAQVESNVLPPDWILPLFPGEVDELPSPGTTAIR